MTTSTSWAYGSATVEQATAGTVRVIATVNQDSTVTVVTWTDEYPDGRTLPQADARSVASGNALVVMDPAAHLGSTNHYWVDINPDGPTASEAGVVSIAMAFPITDAGDYAVVINDPVHPGLEAVCAWSYGDHSESYSTRGAAFDVIGRADRVGIGGVRSSRSGTMDLLTKTVNEAEALRDVLATGRVVLVRVPEEADPAFGTFYAQIGDVTSWRPLKDVRRPERGWSLPFSQAAEPSLLQMTKVGNSWQDVMDANVTWQELLDRSVTWLETLNDPEAVL